MSLKRSLRHLGYIKNKSYYVNTDNQVFSARKGGEMYYEANWHEDYKMLWTNYPTIYQRVSFKSMNIFYDIIYKDAYYYDDELHVIMPAGFYNPKTHEFKNYFWNS